MFDTQNWGAAASNAIYLVFDSEQMIRVRNAPGAGQDHIFPSADRFQLFTGVDTSERSRASVPWTPKIYNDGATKWSSEQQSLTRFLATGTIYEQAARLARFKNPQGE